MTSVNRNGFNIITIVLGADSKKFRTKDSIELIEYTYSNYELIDLNNLVNEEYIRWENINKKRININKAKDSKIDILLEEYNLKKYPVKKDKEKNINIEINNIKLDFDAPIKKGEKIADLRVLIDYKEVIKTKIIINNNIERKDTKFYFIELIKYLK